MAWHAVNFGWPGQAVVLKANNPGQGNILVLVGVTSQALGWVLQGKKQHFRFWPTKVCAV